MKVKIIIVITVKRKKLIKLFREENNIKNINKRVSNKKILNYYYYYYYYYVNDEKNKINKRLKNHKSFKKDQIKK